MVRAPHVHNNLKEAVSLKHQKKYAEALDILSKLVRDGGSNDRVKSIYIDTLLKLGKYEEILSIAYAKEIDGRAAAIASDLVRRNLSEVQKLQLARGPVLPHVAAILMIKDEEDIIGRNLGWHYHMGIRKFCVLDNGSTDGSRAAILAFRNRCKDAEVLLIDDVGVAHFQGVKTTGMLRFCATYWPEMEWVLLIDADEFLCCSQPLGQALSTAQARKADAIVVPKSFYYVTENYNHVTTDPFYNKITCRGALTHVSAKVIIRNGNFIISQGNHFITSPENRYIEYTGGYELGLHYREYQIRSLVQTRIKILNGGKAISAAEDKNFLQVGGGHWKEWYSMYRSEGEPAVEKVFKSMMKKQSNLLYDPLPLEISDATGDSELENSSSQAR